MTFINITVKRTMAAAVAALAVAGAASAQGIDFMHQATLAQATARAKAEGKMVFLDCYTSWCGPCKMMASKVFTLAEVGEYMNPRFVSVKIDMEQGEGPSLAERLQVSAYPTFIIFNGDGGEVGRFLGGSDAAGFIQRVKDNSTDNGSADMDRRFQDGERDPQFLMDYLTTLGNAYKRNQCNEVAEILLEGKAETFAADSSLARIFMQHISNPFCPAFSYTAAHPQALQAAVGEVPVAMKLRSVWDRYPLTLISERDGNAALDTERFDAYVALMRSCGVADADAYRLNALMAVAQRAQDWPAYVGCIEEYMATPGIDMDDMRLCKAASPVMEKCTDPNVRVRVKDVLQARLDDINAGRRQPQTKIGQMTLSRPTSQILEMLIRTLNGEQVLPGK